MLEGACPNSTTKVKIDKWLGKDAKVKHERFLVKWHELLCGQTELVLETLQGNEQLAMEKNTMFLKWFYLMPYDVDRDFYEQFEERRMMFER